MEVHHHAHSPGKKWRHYLWEFLMLFLAVFCGFLAENIREHKVETNRAKQLLYSLIIDIKSDIDQLNRIIIKRDKKALEMDSVSILLTSNLDKANGSSLYYNAVHAGRRLEVTFVPNDGTLIQLKNAGGLRLIRNQRVVDSIMKYDIAVRNAITLSQIELGSVDHYRIISSRIFDASVFDKMLDKNNQATKPAGNPQLLPHDNIAMSDLIGSLHYLKTINRGLRGNFDNVKSLAVSVIKTIEEEYHIN